MFKIKVTKIPYTKIPYTDPKIETHNIFYRPYTSSSDSSVLREIDFKMIEHDPYFRSISDDELKIVLVQMAHGSFQELHKLASYKFGQSGISYSLIIEYLREELWKN